MAAIWLVDGLDGSALTALWSVSTDVFTALVWLGKSLLAALTSDVASLWIVVSCDFRPLIPLLEVTLGRFLTEFLRLVRSEQYAGLLLPQPAGATSATAATTPQARASKRGPAFRDLRRVMPVHVWKAQLGSLIDWKIVQRSGAAGCAPATFGIGGPRRRLRRPSPI